MKELVKQIAKIQQELKAPKNQRNNFGGYNYRSCEDILEAVKPLLGDLILTITDDVVAVGERIYVKATATITDGENSVSNTAFAREAEARKGMDDSQITGATSSYARKYALNGLLCIDDTKDADATNTHDADATNTHDKDEPKPAEKAKATREERKQKIENLIKTAEDVIVKVKDHKDVFDLKQIEFIDNLLRQLSLYKECEDVRTRLIDVYTKKDEIGF